MSIPKDFSDGCCLTPCLFNFVFNTVLRNRGQVDLVHITQINFYTPSSTGIVGSGGRRLPAEPGTSAAPATDTVPGAADAGAAGCSRAAGPAGSSHSHLAGRTGAESVGRAKQSKRMS